MTYRRVIQADAHFELFGCAVKTKTSYFMDETFRKG